MNVGRWPTTLFHLLAEPVDPLVEPGLRLGLASVRWLSCGETYHPRRLPPVSADWLPLPG
jgi:hypothetical protein